MTMSIGNDCRLENRKLLISTGRLAMMSNMSPKPDEPSLLLSLGVRNETVSYVGLAVRDGFDDGIIVMLGIRLGASEGDELFVGVELGMDDLEGGKLKLGATEGRAEGTESDMLISL